VPASAVSLEDAIRAYLFNAQLVTLPGRRNGADPSRGSARDAVGLGLAGGDGAGNGPIRELLVVDVRQSMANGGGPACLRLRVVAEPEAVDPRFMADEAKLDRLAAVVEARVAGADRARGFARSGLVGPDGGSARGPARRAWAGPAFAGEGWGLEELI
jgi:succinylarginine dihydrolase